MRSWLLPMALAILSACSRGKAPCSPDSCEGVCTRAGECLTTWVGDERVIDAPASVVWDTLARREQMCLCHPFCETSETHQWPGPASRDQLTYYSGETLHREFVSWLPGEGYDLEIGPGGHPVTFVSWRITPVDDQSSRLSIRIAPFPPETDEVGIEAFYAMVDLYAEHLMKGYEYCVEEAAPVARNQFGVLEYFSPSVAE